MWGLGREWKLGWPLKKSAGKGTPQREVRGAGVVLRPGSAAGKNASSSPGRELAFIPGPAIPGPAKERAFAAVLSRGPLIVPVRQLDLIGRLQRADEHPEVVHPASPSPQERERARRSLMLSSVRAPRIKPARKAKKTIEGRAQEGRESA